MMWQQEKKAQEILDAAELSGYELATSGTMTSETLAIISQPLVDQEEYLERLNEINKKAGQ